MSDESTVDRTAPADEPEPDAQAAPEAARGDYGYGGELYHADPAGPSLSIEDARRALERQARAELINELLADGTAAASFTAVAGIVKAKFEATTERQRIASDERKAAVHEREETKRAKLQAQNPPDSAS